MRAQHPGEGGLGEIIQDDGMKIGDGRNGQLLPALQIAGRNDMLQNMAILFEDFVVKLVRIILMPMAWLTSAPIINAGTSEN